MLGMTEFLFVSLSTAQFDARECTPRIYFKNDPSSLSIAFLHYFSDRKALSKDLEMKTEALRTLQCI